MFHGRDLFKSAFGEINDPASLNKPFVWPPVIDPDDDGFAILKVGNADQLVERHIPHGTGQAFIIENLIIRCARLDPAIMFRIPGCLAIANNAVASDNRWLRLVFGMR